jgi:two-component system, NarL family, response regulator LiaR
VSKGAEGNKGKSNPIKVMIVDDHAIVRQGLRYYLSMQTDMEVVGESSDGQEAVDQAARLNPDVVLMDMIMPVMNGIEAAERLKETQPGAKVIMLTTFSDQEQVVSAIRAGAQGYLLKDTDPVDIAEAIRGVHDGRPQLHPSVTTQLMAHLAAPPHEAAPEARLDALTAREVDVLRLIAKGYSNKEIATACDITEKTAKTHVSNILGKLGLADRTQAALFAVKQGIAEN